MPRLALGVAEGLAVRCQARKSPDRAPRSPRASNPPSGRSRPRRMPPPASTACRVARDQRGAASSERQQAAGEHRVETFAGEGVADAPHLRAADVAQRHVGGAVVADARLPGGFTVSHQRASRTRASVSARPAADWPPAASGVARAMFRPADRCAPTPRRSEPIISGDDEKQSGDDTSQVEEVRERSPPALEPARSDARPAIRRRR